MSAPRKNRKSKKGREPTEPSAAICKNVCNQETADSDSQCEIEILRKDNEILNKKLEACNEECTKIQNEKQELKNEMMEILSENKQLKQEIEKLKVMGRKRNVDSETLQSSVMDMEHSEDTLESTQNMLQNSANQPPACTVTAGDWNHQTSSNKPAMDLDYPGTVKDDWSESALGQEVNWDDNDGEKDNASGCDKNVTERTHEHNYEGSYGREDAGKNQRSYDGQQKQKSKLNKQSYTPHVNDGGNYKQYDNRNRRGNGCKYDRADEQQTDYGRRHAGSDVRYDHSQRVYVANGKRRMYNDSGCRHENYFDQRRESGLEFRNRKREEYQQGYDNNEQFSKVKIVDITGDLFLAPKDHSLAHCVAADLRMGSGIAVQFRQNFKRVAELVSQRKKVGQVAVLEENGRFIYYLITKKVSTGKPRMVDLEDSLEDMKEHIKKNEVKYVAIPRLGCGLDRLNWNEVRLLLQKVFADVDVTITVYNFTVDVPNSSDHPPKKSLIYVTEKLMRLVNIDHGTLLVVFGSECGYVDNTMEELDEKFRFINDYKAKPKVMGDVLQLEKRNEIICVLIVKKHKNDLMSYPALEDCFNKLKRIFKKNEYLYMGFQAFLDGGDDLTVAKIVTLLKMIFAYTKCETWICWPAELKGVFETFNLPKEGDKLYVNHYEK